MLLWHRRIMGLGYLASIALLWATGYAQSTEIDRQTIQGAVIVFYASGAGAALLFPWIAVNELLKEKHRPRRIGIAAFVSVFPIAFSVWLGWGASLPLALVALGVYCIPIVSTMGYLAAHGGSIAD